MKDDWESVRENIDFESLNMSLMSKGFYFNGSAIINMQSGVVYGCLELGDYGWVISEHHGMSIPQRVKYLVVQALSKALNRTFANVSESEAKYSSHHYSDTGLLLNEQAHQVINDFIGKSSIKRIYAINEIAKQVGVTSSAVGTWLKGGKMNRFNANKVIKQFGNN